MLSLLHLILLSLWSTEAKLIINSLNELTVNGEANQPLISSEARLIKTIMAPSQTCPYVDERVSIYEVWLVEEIQQRPLEGEKELEEETVEEDGEVEWDRDAEGRRRKLVRKTVELHGVVDSTHYTIQIINAENPSISDNAVIRPYLNCLDGDSEYVLRVVRDELFIPPSTLPYNFSKNPVNTFGQFGQPYLLDMIIFKGEVKNGFFIEAGAEDFETHTNTLYFEKEHGWSGVLVEAHPGIYPLGLKKNRKAYSLTHCLGLETAPHNASFIGQTVQGGMAGIVPEKNENTFFVQCFPLYTVILAAGNRTVNYLSLDIEGAELKVLQTVPWDKVDIEIITVETFHAGKVFPGSQEDIRNYLESVGYVLLTVVVIDDVYIRKDLLGTKYHPSEEAMKRFHELNSKRYHAERIGNIEERNEYTHKMENLKSAIFKGDLDESNAAGKLLSAEENIKIEAHTEL